MLWLPGYFVEVEILSTSPSGYESNDITLAILLERNKHHSRRILSVVAESRYRTI